MTKDKKILLTIAMVALLVVAGFLLADKYNHNMAVEASGGFPYQIGLTGVTMVQCFPSCCAPTCTCCAGGTLCMTKDVATCSNYQEVTGAPAGGMGSNALFSQAAIGQAGLSPGGQLIAGGASPALMDSGILASGGGCYGCTARLDMVDKIKNWFNRTFIAVSE